MKAELITRLALLPDDDPRLREVDRLLNGTDPTETDEARLLLVEVARHPRIRMTPAALWRLGVKSVAETSFGGRPRYTVRAVEEYLKSPQCAARRRELLARRKAREGAARQ